MLRRLALLLVLLLPQIGLPSPVEASLRGEGFDGFRLSAIWGGMSSSQMVRDIPVSFWSVQVNAPILDPIGLSAQLRFDSPVFGDPRQAMSLLVHPGHTDYGIGFSIRPPGSSVSAEYHHVSGHAVAALYEARLNRFEDIVSDGGSSNFAALALHWDSGTVLRLGYGGLTNDANTTPVLLGFDGVLLNSRTSRGPLLAWNSPLPRFLGLEGHAGAFFVHDTQGIRRYSGNHVSWGVSLARPLSNRAQIGLSYVGDNGTPEVKRANTMISLFVRLSWGLTR